MTGRPPIRDAASILLIRDTPQGAAVLMGQRGATAAFMPDKFVFPGGAVDALDAGIALASPLDPISASRLKDRPADGKATCLPHALAAAAIRELWEEAGLILGNAARWAGAVPPDWQSFAATGHVPAAAALSYVFRAITPAGPPRRFDARFFVAKAEFLANDPDDFSRASDELSYLRWVPIAEARNLNLPFITEVVLAEVADHLRSGAHQPLSVPFFDNSGPLPVFSRIA